MERTFDFGKVDYTGNGRKSNAVTVTARLELKAKGLGFSCTADVWNEKRTDILMGGQCLEEVKALLRGRGGERFMRLFSWWEKYHLNDLHPGTLEQEAEIEKWKAEGNRYDYTAACEHLKKVGLYEVEHEGKPHKYGHAWLFRPIPDTVLEDMKKTLS